MCQAVGGDSDRRRVVFLDRDGVINRNRDGDYVRTADEFEFLPGALEGLARLKQADCTVVVVSNQAGVGSGFVRLEELERINEKMLAGITAHGGEIAAICYCTHRKDEGCACRKPGTGLFEQAVSDLDISLDGSYFIGDALSDMQAGINAGCRTIIVLTGRASASEIESWERKPDCVAADLLSAVEWIVDDRAVQSSTFKVQR